MSIAQQVQIRNLESRLAGIEAGFREAAEVGNTKARVDNLEQTVSGMLLELKRLSKLLNSTTNEAAEESQGESCQNSLPIKSGQSSALASAVRSTAQTANSGASAKTR